MRKAFTIIFILFLFLFTGCKKEKATKEKINTYFKSLKDGRISETIFLKNKIDDAEIIWNVIDAKRVNFSQVNNDVKITVKEKQFGFITLAAKAIVGDEDIDFGPEKILVSTEVLSSKFIAENIKNELTSTVIEYNNDYRFSIFDSEFKITYSSSNEELLNSQTKKVKQPIYTEKVNLTITVNFNNEKVSVVKEVVMTGINDLVKRKEALDSLIENTLKDNYITVEKINLPIEYKKYSLTYRYTSTNVNALANDGEVLNSLFERKVSLIVEIIDRDGKVLGFPEKYDLIIAKKDYALKEEKIEKFLNILAPKEIKQINFDKAYANISPFYNHLIFDIGFAPVVHTDFLLNHDSVHKPNVPLSGVKMITIHDTWKSGAGFSAKQWAMYLKDIVSDGGVPIEPNRQASWHFCAGDDGLWQSVPIAEASWHAGDGSRVFKMIDTKVKATLKYPVVEISSDGYYMFNKQKSQVKAPTAKNGEILHTHDITDFGILTEIGSNGNYFINSSYFNADYGKISNQGGNYYSISFESAVNDGTDYLMTLRHLSKMVAKLLIDNNLGLNRIMMHNSFSGKPCPYALIKSGHWTDFLDLVAMEKYYLENLSDIKFKFTSLSEILDEKGRISLGHKGEEIKYKITYDFNGTTYEKQFTSKIV